MPTLKELRELAATKNATIATQRDTFGWSYWLLDENGQDLFEDDNFYSCKNSLKAGIDKLADIKTQNRSRFVKQLANFDFS